MRLKVLAGLPGCVMLGGVKKRSTGPPRRVVTLLGGQVCVTCFFHVRLMALICACFAACEDCAIVCPLTTIILPLVDPFEKKQAGRSAKAKKKRNKKQKLKKKWNAPPAVVHREWPVYNPFNMMKGMSSAGCFSLVSIGGTGIVLPWITLTHGAIMLLLGEGTLTGWTSGNKQKQSHGASLTCIVTAEIGCKCLLTAQAPCPEPDRQPPCPKLRHFLSW